MIVILVLIYLRFRILSMSYFENITIIDSRIYGMFGQLMGSAIPSSSDFITYSNIYVDSSTMDENGYIYHSLTSSTTFKLENIDIINSSAPTMIYIEVESASNQFTFDSDLIENITFSNVSATQYDNYVMYLKPNSMQTVALRNIKFIKIQDEVTYDYPIFYFESVTNWQVSNITFSDFKQAQDISPVLSDFYLLSKSKYNSMNNNNITTISQVTHLIICAKTNMISGSENDNNVTSTNYNAQNIDEPNK